MNPTPEPAASAASQNVHGDFARELASLCMLAGIHSTPAIARRLGVAIRDVRAAFERNMAPAPFQARVWGKLLGAKDGGAKMQKLAREARV